MAFKEIYQYYLQRRFSITTVHADGEFAPLKVLIESLPGGPLVNLASPDEHVPEIKRQIQVVKEQSLAALHSLPFQHIPKLLMIHIVLNAIKMLNFFPTKGGISDTMSPKTIMSGEIGSSNNELHSCRLLIAEKRGANNQQEQSKAPLTVRYEIHTSPRQEYSDMVCRTNHVAQQFSYLSLDNGTEKWRKAVLDNLWKSHIDQHSVASIWSVGSRQLSPKQPFAIW
jgi:hypothetical protein